MKVGHSLNLMWAFIVLPLVQSAASESLAPQDVQPHLKALSTVQKFQQAVPQNPCPTGPVKKPAPPLDFVSFAKSQSCNDLLSSDPPSWVLTNPKAGIFKDPASWQPFCPAYALEKIKRQSDSVDRDLALTQLEAWTVQRDYCNNANSDRYSGSFKEPSQSDFNLQPMGPEARARLVEDFEWEKYKLSKTCCGSDDACKILVRSISLRLCKPQTDPKKPDPCVVNGTHYQLGSWEEKSQWLAKLKKGISPSQLKDQFPVSAGEISVSPLEDTQTHQPYFGVNIAGIRHELGHGCSRIKRDLMISQGNTEATHDLLNLSDCSLSPERSSIYKRMGEGLGLSSESLNCIETNAKGAKKARFPGKAACKNGCERDYQEESFANVMEFLQMDPSEMASVLIPDLCSAKDSRHGFAADDFHCTLSMPWFKVRVEEGLACKK